MSKLFLKQMVLLKIILVERLSNSLLNVVIVFELYLKYFYLKKIFKNYFFLNPTVQ